MKFRSSAYSLHRASKTTQLHSTPKNTGKIAKPVWIAPTENTAQQAVYQPVPPACQGHTPIQQGLPHVRLVTSAGTKMSLVSWGAMHVLPGSTATPQALWTVFCVLPVNMQVRLRKSNVELVWREDTQVGRDKINASNAGWDTTVASRTSTQLRV